MSDYHEMLRPVFRIFEKLAENQLARLEDGCKAALELEEMLVEIRKPSEEEGFEVVSEAPIGEDPVIEMLQKQLDETTAERDRCIHRIKVLEAGVRVARRALEDAGE